VAFDSFVFFVVGEVDGATRFKYSGSSHAAAFRGVAPNNQLISARFDYSKYGFDKAEIELGIGWDDALDFQNNDGLVFYVDMPTPPFADPGHRFKHFAGLITSIRKSLHNGNESVKIVARGPAYILKNIYTKYTETFVNASPEQIAKTIWFRHVYNDPVYFYVSGGLWLPKFDIDQAIYGTADPYPFLSVLGSSGITIGRYEITHNTRVWDIFDRLAAFASYNSAKNFVWGYQPWWRPPNGTSETHSFQAGFYFWDTKLAQFQSTLHTFGVPDDVRELDEVYENATVTDVLIWGGRLADGRDFVYEQSLSDTVMREGSGRQRFVVNDPSIKTVAAAAQLATGILNIYGNDDPYYQIIAKLPSINSGGTLMPPLGRIALKDLRTGATKQIVDNASSIQVECFQSNQEPTVKLSLGHRPLPNIQRYNEDTILGNGPNQDVGMPNWTFPPDATNSITASVTNPTFPTDSVTASLSASESIVDDKDIEEFPDWWDDMTPTGTGTGTGTATSPTVTTATVTGTVTATATVTATVTASASASATATESLAPAPAEICATLYTMWHYYYTYGAAWFATRDAGFMEWEELVGCDGLDFANTLQCLYEAYDTNFGSWGLAIYPNTGPIVAAENYWNAPYTDFWRTLASCPLG